MAYNIFLKSLRSLDGFRENPHIKIPPKSPCINFQSPNIFKIQFLFRNNFSFNFRPKQPSIHPAFWPRAAHQAAPPFPSSLPHPSRWLRRLLLCTATSSSCHGYHALPNASLSLILAIIIICSLYSLPPFNPTTGCYRVPRLSGPSPGPVNRPHHARSSPHLPRLTLPISRSLSTFIAELLSAVVSPPSPEPR
jgi:hypothetical protein